jgi:hypothetical protein
MNECMVMMCLGIFFYFRKGLSRRQDVARVWGCFLGCFLICMDTLNETNDLDRTTLYPNIYPFDNMSFQFTVSPIIDPVL